LNLAKAPGMGLHAAYLGSILTTFATCLLLASQSCVLV